MSETAAQQIDRLAQFIVDEIPGEPSRDEGAVDTAIRLLARVKEPSGQIPDDFTDEGGDR